MLPARPTTFRSSYPNIWHLPLLQQQAPFLQERKDFALDNFGNFLSIPHFLTTIP
jgi:hypothetical protein